MKVSSNKILATVNSTASSSLIKPGIVQQQAQYLYKSASPATANPVQSEKPTNLKPPSTSNKPTPSPDTKLTSVLWPNSNNSAFKPQIANLDVSLPLMEKERSKFSLFPAPAKSKLSELISQIKKIIAERKGEPALKVGIFFPALEVSRCNQRLGDLHHQLIALETEIKPLEDQAQDLSEEIKPLESQLALKAKKKGFFDFFPPFYLSLFNDQLKVSFGEHPTEFDLLLQKRLGNLKLRLIDTQESIRQKKVQQRDLEYEKAEIESLIPRFSELAELKEEYDKAAMQSQAKLVAEREQIRARIKELEGLPEKYSCELKKLIADLEKINKNFLPDMSSAIKTGGNIRSENNIAERKLLTSKVTELKAVLERDSLELEQLVTALREINKKLPDQSIIEAGDFNSPGYSEAVIAIR